LESGVEDKYGKLVAFKPGTKAVNLYREGDSVETSGLDAVYSQADVILEFPDDEPQFVFRGQDQLAPNALWHYFETLKRHGLDSMAQGVYAQWLAMVEWQRANASRVKLPD
jgi:hypothetical protein